MEIKGKLEIELAYSKEKNKREMIKVMEKVKSELMKVEGD